MGIYRPVRIALWTDEKIVEQFSPEDKYFWLYLLTNPHTNQLGIYNFVNRTAAFELGYSVEAVSVLLDRFESKYRIILHSRETTEIAILNYLLHSITSGGKPLEDCIKKDMKSVKDKSLIDNVFVSIIDKDISPTIKNIINNYFGIVNDKENNKQDIKTKAQTQTEGCGQYVGNTEKYDSANSKLPNIFKDVIDYLNDKAKTKYRYNTPVTQKFIRARQNEGFTLQDFYDVIDVKCSQWLDDAKMSAYLRPETLFGTKFESYLNESGAKQPSSNSASPSPDSDYDENGVRIRSC